MARGDYNRTPEYIQELVIDMYVVEELGSIMIGRELGLSKTLVLRILKNNNISRRSISEAGKKLFEKGYVHPLQGTAKPKPEPIYTKQPHLSADGYLHIWRDGKLWRYHRWLWTETNGSIPDGYVLHHIDGDKINNNLQNLELLKNSEHTKLHWKLGDIRN